MRLYRRLVIQFRFKAGLGSSGFGKIEAPRNNPWGLNFHSLSTDFFPHSPFWTGRSRSRFSILVGKAIFRSCRCIYVMRLIGDELYIPLPLPVRTCGAFLFRNSKRAICGHNHPSYFIASILLINDFIFELLFADAVIPPRDRNISVIMYTTAGAATKHRAP